MLILGSTQHYTNNTGPAVTRVDCNYTPKKVKISLHYPSKPDLSKYSLWLGECPLNLN